MANAKTSWGIVHRSGQPFGCPQLLLWLINLPFPKIYRATETSSHLRIRESLIMREISREGGSVASHSGASWGIVHRLGQPFGCL